jgi:hypothetical protein
MNTDEIDLTDEDLSFSFRKIVLINDLKIKAKS